MAGPDNRVRSDDGIVPARIEARNTDPFDIDIHIKRVTIEGDHLDGETYTSTFPVVELDGYSDHDRYRFATPGTSWSREDVIEEETVATVDWDDFEDDADTDTDMHEHDRVITCSCGETFEDEEAFERHTKRARRQTFNEKAQKWIEFHLGEPFASYHETIRTGGGIAAYGTLQGDHDAIDDPDPTMENIEEGARRFCQDALLEGNVEVLMDHVETNEDDT